MNRMEAEKFLSIALNNPNAKFRDGQWEAIDALVTRRKKILVVQRTGWGKSSVYFIATRLLRNRGFGPTIIVSPLLALMRNQVEAARRLGICAITINSSNREHSKELIEQVLSNKVDCILISPERLANDDFVNAVLQPIASKIGLLVVDEAHCISDWGHDFRPDYRRLVNVLKQMPPNMPILATTATANNRVIQDVTQQLGDIDVIRGTLARESLSLQNIALTDQSSRLAWLVKSIPIIEGSGIVYVLTKRDAEQVKDWLVQQGINAKAYYSGIEHSDFKDTNAYREHLEDLLLNNKLKVLVATMALGMGYDKPDLSFVIHYQAPSSIVSYYQQVGRAGRGINESYGILLSGSEDDRIHEFFRRSAFPSERDVRKILGVLEKFDGLSIREIEEKLNIKNSQIEKVIKYLSVESPAPVIKSESKWFRTPTSFQLDHERIARLTGQREQEWHEVKCYATTRNCLMEYLGRSLDDIQAQPCGKCANCLDKPILPVSVDSQTVIKASQFIRHAEMPIIPKIQVAANAFPEYGLRGNLPQGLQASEGRVLSRWGDSGWGCLVEEDKHNGHFRDDLVTALADMISQRWKPYPYPEWIACVPSLNHPELVPELAQRLAFKLEIPYKEVITKVRANDPQKLQNNRFYQCRNLDGVFSVSQTIPAGPVLLFDDVIDSGWTMTVLAALLRRNGSGNVYPVALATSTTSD